MPNDLKTTDPVFLAALEKTAVLQNTLADWRSGAEEDRMARGLCCLARNEEADKDLNREGAKDAKGED